MRGQTAILDYRKRKQAYDRVQELIATHDPVICLVSPDVLVGAKASLRGTRPSVMRNYLLWNADELYWGELEEKGDKGRQAATPSSH
jgi:ABC-type transport system substrate-binding protein